MAAPGRTVAYEISGMARTRRSDRVRIPLSTAAMGVAMAPPAQSRATKED